MADKGLNRAAKRIQRELKEIKDEEFTKNGISVEPMEDNLMKLKGKILGSSGTPYEGGIYMLEIKVPDGYPFKPVKVRFLTKIWHPNISSVTGAVCLNILKRDWVACITLRTVLLSLQVLLSAPEPDDPLDVDVATQYRENHEAFKLTAKYLSQVYASAPGSNSEVERNLLDMEADEETSGMDSDFDDSEVDEARASLPLSSSFWDFVMTVIDLNFG